MASPKVVVVFGATGRQGGSVARALVKDGQFTVRAITRHGDSEKAKELEKEGCDVVVADLDDKPSVVEAMRGAYGVFLVTNYWEDMDEEREFIEGKNAVDAAIECGIEHLVYSGLEDAKELCGYSVPCFDGKGRVEEYIRSCGLPYTIVRLSFYMGNVFNYFVPKKQEDGSFHLEIPMEGHPLYMVCVREVGPIIVCIFGDPGEYAGRTLGLSSEQLTVDEMAQQMTECLGVEVNNGNVPLSEFCKLNIPGIDVYCAMFKYFQSDLYKRDIELTRKLNPEWSTFREWLARNKEALLAAMNQ
ncbi:nmrA-like family domain-containing protein 1 [Haliotis rubra]|uniref:nmrA-like family domain-containing protein 1 n=1 Tax=Haliotis rubra TaxID=36100 RepID=UPI001EE58CF6|nr:nmrA-like family domain-containing protein 1 [Haliotis rubra]